MIDGIWFLSTTAAFLALAMTNSQTRLFRGIAVTLMAVAFAGLILILRLIYGGPIEL